MSVMRWAFALLGMCAASRGSAPPVRAWQGSITLPTWQEGLPETVPHFPVLGADRAWYPYPVRANLLPETRKQTWRTLNLENEYLVCTVLPDLGGHLYSCRDKLSGYEMFYANPSIKKAMIGLRGAWAALGVELNFPIGHSLLTVSPVDFRVTQTDDSASVWVGATDRVTGMRWRVEFTLKSGSALLRQNVRIENPTAMKHQYYWWTNAAVTLREDTRFVLPAKTIASHGKTETDTWPVGKSGLDRSVPANFPQSHGWFANNTREPFFAVYHSASKTGTLHYADPTAVPGKKIWAWGRDENKQMRAALSDDASQYVEIQAGVFDNQETFGDLEPNASRSFSEFWIPLRKLDGISEASPHAVVYLTRKNGTLTVQVLPIQTIAPAKLSVVCGSKTAFSGTAEISPAAMWTKSIPGAPAGPCTFHLDSASDAPLLAYTEGAMREGAIAGAPPANGPTVHSLVLQAAAARANGSTVAARTAIEGAAALDPTDSCVRFEQVRQGARDPDLWEHLSADPERVLEIADLYIQAERYRDALDALMYPFPPVPPARTEPGAVMPQDHALLNYYRGYCHRALGQYFAEDFRVGSILPVRAVFPHRPGERRILEAAIEVNADDASAHYLLGLWFLNAKQIPDGSRELQAAHRLRPALPEARALLAQLKLPVAALPVADAPPPAPEPRKTAPPAPPPVPKPASAPAEPAAGRTALPAGIPIPGPTFARDTAVAALDALAAGDLGSAQSFFTPANFKAAKQPEIVRAAYIETEMRKLLAMAEAHQCADADRGLTNLGFEDKSLPFTFTGFGANMKGARFQYWLGVVEAACVDDKDARKRWHKVSSMRAAITSPDFAYSYMALSRMGPASGLGLVLQHIEQALKTARAEDRPALLYNQGVILHLLRHYDAAAAAFREGAAKAPAGMLRYLNRDALRTLTKE